MARYIDAYALKSKLKNIPQCGGEILLVSALDAVDKQPTADVVEVVRCKDCRHSETCPDRILWCNECNMLADLDGYCYRGERREV